MSWQTISHLATSLKDPLRSCEVPLLEHLGREISSRDEGIILDVTLSTSCGIGRFSTKKLIVITCQEPSLVLVDNSTSCFIIFARIAIFLVKREKKWIKTSNSTVSRVDRFVHKLNHAFTLNARHLNLFLRRYSFI